MGDVGRILLCPGEESQDNFNAKYFLQPNPNYFQLKKPIVKLMLAVAVVVYYLLQYVLHVK